MVRWTLALQVFNIFFVIVFALEAVMKLLSFGPVVYFREAWNKFDFIVVVVSIVGLFVSAGVGANVVRVLRIARVFRLIKKAKHLNELFNTLIVSSPSLWNIGSLLFVLFFIFAVLGTHHCPWSLSLSHLRGVHHTRDRWLIRDRSMSHLVCCVSLLLHGRRQA